MSIPFGHLCKYIGTQVLGKAYAKDLENYEMLNCILLTKKEIKIR